MKKGFTIIEVSILFVIFLIVAFLVAPLSIDDTVQARNIYRWKNVQQDFENIFNSINTDNSEPQILVQNFIKELEKDTKTDTDYYKITFLNSSAINRYYKFDNYKQTGNNATIATKIFDTPQNGVYGLVMYDVNGKKKPNTWGKDVFGYNIKQNGFEPFCQQDSLDSQKRDCAKHGTGLCCSNYYLIGGEF